MKFYRNFGCQLAIDDFGEGFSNLRVWSEIRPDFVKLDRHFIDGIAIEPLKYHFVKAILELASTSGSRIIAEGMEREDDFLVVRDLNIECGQGYYIAKPSESPDRAPSPDIKNVLSEKRVTAFHYGSLHSVTPSAKQLMHTIEIASPNDSIERVKYIFDCNESLEILPVVDETGTPIGTISRKSILSHMVSGGMLNLPCTTLTNYEPLITDAGTSIQEMGTILAKADRRYLSEGFLVTSLGKYVGIIDGHTLVATITDMQAQSARYANPLSGLPGNVPIEQHIDRIIAADTFAVVCRVDLNEFKPFNNTFGYQKGDDLIKLLGQVISEVTAIGLDFLGHLGGDDFVVVFQSDDWTERCRVIIEAFTARAENIFPIEARVSKLYTTESRTGDPIQYNWPSISIGVVKMNRGEYAPHLEVLTAAETAKMLSKQDKTPMFIERRRNNANRDVESA